MLFEAHLFFHFSAKKVYKAVITYLYVQHSYLGTENI